LLIDKPFITLVGEDRDSTRIIFAELRANWRKDHPDDWGSAVINLGDNAHDFTLVNMTVYNNYGSVYEDHDHQFAIRGFGATRTIIFNCKIKADGGDTISLWNKISGMYYHAYCSFEGWVDYVCPRGWCYITDCEFYGHNTPSASIWHDGSQDPDQKLVIRNSFFDGVPGFPLGRHHRDAQFYILDCTFAENMADRPIYRAKDPAEYQWAERYYYYNSHRDGGDYAWHKDNLQEAVGTPAPGDINPVWTFNGQWDPEKNIPGVAVLPFAAFPAPGNRQTQVGPDPHLRWLAARDATGYKVYFGETYPPAYVSDVKNPHYVLPGPLKADTQYYWRIETVHKMKTVQGKVWTFRTAR